jgi:uncharacterized repeat protein (TIGR01451 family)
MRDSQNCQTRRSVSLKLMELLAGLIIASVFRAARPVGFFDVDAVFSPLPHYRNSCKIPFNSMKRLGLILAFMTTLATQALASEAVELRTQLIAEVRETLDTQQGRPVHRMVPASRLSQGQVVYYTVRITNPTPVFANNVVVSQRVPANTTYMKDSAVGPGAEVEFSLDGGVTFARPEELKLDDGTRAPPERYTHIRWRLRNPLAPGAVALARFRAVFR